MDTNIHFQMEVDGVAPVLGVALTRRRRSIRKPKLSTSACRHRLEYWYR